MDEKCLTAPIETSWASLRCVRCGYDLRSQPPEGLCPECGLSVEQTLSVGTHLQRGRPGWLARLWIGTWMLIFIPSVAVAAVPASVMIAERFRMMMAPTPELFFWVLSGVPIAIALAHVMAVYLLTSREHRFEHQIAGNSVRVALRFSVLGSLVTGGCVAGLVWNNNNSQTEVFAYIAAGSFLLLIPTYVLTFIYLRKLARRIGHASLAEHCIIVSVGVSVSILMPMCMPLFRESKSIWPMLIMLVTICLFALWSTYLLFRFAVVFHQSGRIARRNWIAADASALVANAGG